MDTNSTKECPIVEVRCESQFFGKWHIKMPAEKNMFHDFMFASSFFILAILCKFFVVFLPVPLLYLLLFIKNHFKKLFTANSDGTFFNFNHLHMTAQNQNMAQDFYFQNEFTAPVIENGISGETFGVEKQLQWPQYYIDIRGAETAELRERIEKLERRADMLKNRDEQEIHSIQFLESSRLILKQPIYVNISYHPTDGIYVVDCLGLNIYGQGRDEIEAVEDFKTVLEETYFLLKEDKDKLGLQLEKEWHRFEQIMQENKLCR